MLPGRTFVRALLLAILIPTLVCGCAGGGLSKAMNKTLQAVGIKEKPKENKPLPLRLFAAPTLNSGDDGKPSAAVLKIYHLRSTQRFEQAPFNAFLDAAGEQAALGADLLSSNEVVLTPGVKQELSEKLEAGTAAIGVVALFRAPAEGRWRLAFDATSEPLRKEGITIGAHRCALTTSSPGLVTKVAGDPSSLASVRCAAP